MGGADTTSGDPAVSRPSPRVVAAIAAAAVVLAVGGAVGGWFLAGPGSSGGSDRGPVGAPPSTAPAPRVTPPPEPTSAPPPAPPAGDLRVPDLTGQDFTQARRRLRALRLGWQLVFADSGPDRSVERTDPPGGTTVRRGETVKVYVRGAAPPATVPGVVGLSCSRAASLVVEHGLYPDYATGRAGRVVRQDPQPPGELRWNDRVRLYCDPHPTPSVTASA